VVISLQPHFDEGPEDDLQAHREFERGRCLPRQDPSPVQDDVRENEEDFRLIRDHHHSLPAQLTPDLAPYRHLRYITYISYIIYILSGPKSQAEIPGSTTSSASDHRIWRIVKALGTRIGVRHLHPPAFRHGCGTELLRGSGRIAGSRTS
jgi:integrase